MRYLLDTSALLALIENEAGADRVESLIRDQVTLVPFLAILEVHYVTLRERGKTVADSRYGLLKQLPSEILWQADEVLVLTASSFKAGNRLSLADAMIAAFAHGNGAVLVHKDPEFEALAGEGLTLEALPYKSKHKAPLRDKD